MTDPTDTKPVRRTADRSLHPQNDRVGTAGLPISEFLKYYRFPPVYVTADGNEKHETPLCPAVQGTTHYAMCREDALYTYGERWCETCRSYDVDLERKDTGWTDSRYRRADS